MTRNSILLACALVTAVAAAARAEAPAGYDVRAAFAEADQNSNGSIEIDEYYDRLVEIFFAGDANKDGFLSREELARTVVIPESFEQADRDADGRVSRREFVRVRLPLFLQLDTDGDGELSFAEVTAALAERGGK